MGAGADSVAPVIAGEKGEPLKSRSKMIIEKGRVKRMSTTHPMTLEAISEKDFQEVFMQGI